MPEADKTGRFRGLKAGVILYNLLTGRKCLRESLGLEGDYPFMATWPLPKGKTMDWWQTELQRSIQEDRMREHHLLSSWSTESPCLRKEMKRLAGRP